ncbi:MAG TPA: bifunctional N-acetylglucosamine-1-phosphate uridyltransferase/glucosamine-1-phosphate acetyltransferase [Planctomycetes bacterium]|nr:bifunctional N-acetylglucosamine-1-phosphate uridyltransferase/glucosamine-1-phosphate acetyltransferase [Planctomycetota bacterium]
MSTDLDIVILAAGRGTRMQSDIPKVLHSLHGRPLIHHVLDAAEAMRPREIVVIVGHGRDAVKAALKGRPVRFVTQTRQLGTGHAVARTRRLLAGRSGAVMVLSGDVPLIRPETLKSLLAQHRRRRAEASLLTAVVDEPGSLGRVLRDGRGRFTGIVEAREADSAQKAILEINAGLYVFRNAALFDGLKRIRRHAESGESYLPDVIKNLAAEGRKVHTLLLDDPDEAMGINTPAELLNAQAILKRRIAQELAAKGVELVDAASTFVAQGVTIGPGTVIWPFSVILGGVSIGARCSIGPFAHLRAGTVIEDGARVGNFVEVKNSTLGSGSLALHLAYLGDVTVGRGVNIGAGVITANFDGRKKHRTDIRDGAFVGSGAILVAPVTVGAKAVVGAGAVVPSKHHVSDGDVVVGVPARSLCESESDEDPRGKKRVKTRSSKTKREAGQ